MALTKQEKWSEENKNSPDIFRVTMGKIVVYVASILFIGYLVGCDNHANKQEHKVNMHNDIYELKKFINLPAPVESCEWQTGEFPSEGDWWLAATFKVKPDDLKAFLHEPSHKELIEIPCNLQLDSSFAPLKSHIKPDKGSNGAHFISDIYPVSAFASPPLLNGKAMKLSENTVFVLLWTM